MEEVVYLKSENAEVTSTKIVINGATYATRNVASVRIGDVPIGSAPILLATFGCLLLFGSWQLGVPMIFIGLAIGISRGWTNSLVLPAGGGEVMAVKSTDDAFLKQVHDAIVQAISAR